MTNRNLITGTLFASLAAAVLFKGFTFTPETEAAQAQMSACGPRDQLPAEVSTNVDEHSRCFELRMYTIDTDRIGKDGFAGGIDDLHRRFREGEAALFEKLGAEVVGVWQDVERPNTLVYMLAYRDRAARDEMWARFGSAEEWNTLRTTYNVPIQRPQVFMLSATDYSHLR